jgi:putative endopeptidase
VLHGAAAALSSPFVREDFAFNQLFSGATEMLPRWKRCVANTDNALGELLGQEYVARTFTPAAKARAVAIVDNLVKEQRSRIEQLEWMGPATKQEALVKLDAFTRKIGYPDKWRDYSALTVDSGDYLRNTRAARQWASARDWAKIGKPTDRTEWGMTPPTVNAYENPLLNEIVFPAGILQPPFYDPSADDAVNYGAMGAVIGHEMGHAFDDQGRQYDKIGNLRDWWTTEDARRYDAEAQKIVQQFDAYTVLDSATHVQGKLTLGENIGDFGGLTVAYAAMKRALAAKPQPVIDGFTPEQRFFLGWAQVWREIDRPEFVRYLVSADPHSPAKWRVNGPLSNMPEFRAAWGCKESDPMVRPAALRPHIW